MLFFHNLHCNLQSYPYSDDEPERMMIIPETIYTTIQHLTYLQEIVLTD